MQEELVSIITPSYNSKRFIGETIASVQLQSYTNWEMIIVDDCSTDGSVPYIESLIAQEKRIRLIALTENTGAAMARNRALEVAKGRYIAFLDSDDQWHPDKLKKQLAFMRKNRYAFTFTAYTPISEEGNIIYPTIHVPDKIDYNGYCKNTIIGCLTVIIDRDQTGDFKMKNIRSSHDMALWLEIMKRGYLAYGLDEDLATYRLVASSNTAKKLQAAKEVWQVYRDIEKLPLIRSSYYFVYYVFNALKKRVSI